MSLGIPLCYDLFLVAMLILFFFIFYKKGFVSSVVDVFGFVLAYLGGSYVSRLAATKIYDSLIKEKLTAYITEQVIKFQTGMSDVLSEGFLGKLFGSFIAEHSASANASELAEKFVSSSLEGNLINLVRIVVFLLVFILAILLFRLLGNVLEGVNELPLVGFPNQLLGGAMGLIIGLTIMFILCSLISLILGLWQSPWMNKEVIEQSFLFSKLFELNPFYS